MQLNCRVLLLVLLSCPAGTEITLLRTALNNATSPGKLLCGRLVSLYMTGYTGCDINGNYKKEIKEFDII